MVSLVGEVGLLPPLVVWMQLVVVGLSLSWGVVVVVDMVVCRVEGASRRRRTFG